MSRRTPADFAELYRIARRPKTMKSHNAESWAKLESLPSPAVNGRMGFEKMASEVQGHRSGDTKAPHAYQFITYCIKSAWLKRA